MKQLLLLLLISITMVFVGCGDDGDGGTETPNPGAKNGVCRTGETPCDADLICNSTTQKCESTTEDHTGEEGHPCKVGGVCDSGLECNSSSVCIKEQVVEDCANIDCGDLGYNNTVALGGSDSDEGTVIVASGSVTYTAAQFESDTNLNPEGDATITGTSSNSFLIKSDTDLGYQAHFELVKQNITDMVSDKSGNVFIAGSKFNDENQEVNFDFTGGSDMIMTGGQDDIFITKLNSDGSYGWTKVIAGEKTEAVTAMAVDDSGNIYLTGYYEDYTEATVDFDPSEGTDPQQNSDDKALFITKLNSDGSYGWTKTYQGGRKIDANGIAVKGDTIYMIGYVGDDTELNVDGEVKRTSGSFLLRANSSDGVKQHLLSLNSGTMKSIMVDPSGNVLIGGIVSPGDAFIGAYDAKSVVQWSHQFASTSSGQSIVNSVATDSSGDLYLRGTYMGSADFNPDEDIEDLKVAGDGETKNFLTKYKHNGCYCWTKTLAGDEDTGNHSIVIENNNLHIVGSFTGFLNFNPVTDVFDRKTSVDESYDLYHTSWKLK